jgi:hypothetical protein
VATKTDGHHKHHKTNPHHTESSPSHDPRKEHDRRARHHEQNVYAGGGISKNVRLALIVLAGVIGVSVTVLFVGGFIIW